MAKKEEEEKEKVREFLEYMDERLRSNPERYFQKQELVYEYAELYYRNGRSNIEVGDTKKAWNQMDGAFKKMKSVLKESFGATLDFKNGKDATDGFRYPQGLDNPMAEVLKKNRKMRIKQLQRLLNASEGLFPRTWLAELVSKTRMLAQENGRGAIIDFDQNLNLAGLELIPTFFDAIEQEKVLQFDYKPKYNGEAVTLIFHPYYLKEYNQRWFVFGKSVDESGKPLQYNQCGLDRIEGKVTETQVPYIPAEERMWAAKHFQDIVGVTKTNKKKADIRIAAKDEYTFWRIKTKRMHRSQQCLQEFDADKGYGVFQISVKPNPELFSLLLSFGAKIEILEPTEFRNEFAEHVKALQNLYNC